MQRPFACFLLTCGVVWCGVMCEQDAAQRHEEAQKDLNRITDASAQGLTSTRRQAGELLLERNVEECRAERDTWSLLAVFVKYAAPFFKMRTIGM
jgi:hypothetical protein